MEASLVHSPVPAICMIIYMITVFAMAYQQGFSKKALERKRNETFEDFMTGGKSRSGFVVALITIVTFYSGTTFTGRVGFFCTYGVAGLAIIVNCAAVGVVMYFLSEKTWPIARKYHLSTLSDIMELRYQSRWVKLILSIITVGFDIIWLITEIRTLGYAVNLASGGAISVKVGSAIAFAVIVLYVSTGGVASVALIDSFSALVMLGGSLVVLVYLIGFYFNGSWPDAFEAARAVKPDVFVMNPTGDFGVPYWFSSVVLGTLVMMVYPSNFMSICLARSTREVKRSSIATAASGVWLTIFGLFAVIVLGSMSQGYSVDDPQSGILLLCSYAGSPLMLGIVCTFILAASLGTLDSTLIALSGLVSNDIVTNIIHIRHHDPCIGSLTESEEEIIAGTRRNARQEVLRTRIIVLILGAIAFCFSMTDLPLLAILADVATNGYTMAVPAIVLGLYWKKATPQGALASMLITEVIFLGIYASGVHYFYGYFLGVPLLILGFAIHYVVSLATGSKFYGEHQAQAEVFREFL